MPLARPFKGKKGCVVTGFAIAALVIIAFCLLLATGSMGGLIHLIVLKATSGNPEAVHVYGGSSDIFTYIKADSVVVVNDKGLRVAVFGADVNGSVFDYLIKSDVRSITVDSLIIHAPRPSDELVDSTLAPIFLGTLAGMVTRTDTIKVSYGRVVDSDYLLLVDSMRLNARIVDIDDVELDVRMASAFIPLFGSAQAYGTLLIDSTRTTLEEFVVNSPPGSLQLSGYLNTDSTFSVIYKGSLSTDFIPEAPSVTADIAGHASGSIMDPLATLTLSDGIIHYQDLQVGLSLDSIVSSRKQCSFYHMVLSSTEITINASGELDFLNMAWQGVADGTLQNVDLSRFLPESPSTAITGNVAVSCSGSAVKLSNGRVRCDLSHSLIDDYSLSKLTFDCEIDQQQLSGFLQTDFQGGTILSNFSTSLGLDYQPVAWSASLDAAIEDCGIFTSFIAPEITNTHGFTASISGEGSAPEFTVTGNVGLDSFSNGEISVRNTDFAGYFSNRTAEMQFIGELSLDSIAVLDSLQASVTALYADLSVSGSPTDFDATGTIGFASGQYNDLILDKLIFSGDISKNENGIEGRGGVAVDSICVSGAPYSLSAVFIAEPGSVYLDSLRLGAPGDLMLGLSGLFQYGADSLAFALDGIALTRAGKLRLISEGALEFVTNSNGLVLDTLWFDLPSGEIAASGWMEEDSINASAVLSGVDIASFTSMLGLSVPISGILEAEFSSVGRMGDLVTVLAADVMYPTYDEWDQSDSLTLDMYMLEDSLVVDGLWTWTDGVRSGFKIALNKIWDSKHRLNVELSDIASLEAELTGVGDELFYLLPMPFKTNGASVSARLEYYRDSAEFSIGLASYFERLYLTNPGIEFPGLSAYLTYPDQQVDTTYNGRLTLASGEGNETSLQGTILLDVKENLLFEEGALPISLNGYAFEVDLSHWETLISGVGWLQFSGFLRAQSDDIYDKPNIVGELNVDRATISMGGGGVIDGSGDRTSSEPAELPIDLEIRISGDQDIWFRNNYANVELSTVMDISTNNGRLLIGGEVKAVRGGVYLLGREFQITQGDIRILQTTPLGVHLNIQAEAKVRSSVSGAEYTIIVTVTGDPEVPDISLSGVGPSGRVADQDIVTLLTAGMTYGELQQFDSSALGNVAGNVLGQWLASNIRDDVGLDALQFTPDFSSDSTSLVVNAGKYVLPDLFVSYSSDVFSSDAGTLKAQYYFSRDLFFEGTTKSTLTGNQDPSLELHYKYRY